MFDLISLIQAVGYIGLAVIIFAESGLLIGFFLPGDSLLFTAGFLASQNHLNIKILLPLFFVSAVIGDSVGYALGKKFGPKVFKRPDSVLFHKDNLIKAENFFKKHGGKAVVLARFLPVIRTFIPILAGVGRMHYVYFLFFNIFGAILWAIGITLIGYYLGDLIPSVDRYLLPIILLIILLSIFPSTYHILKNKNNRKKFFLHLKKFLKK